MADDHGNTDRGAEAPIGGGTAATEITSFDYDLHINAMGEVQIGDRLLTVKEIEDLPSRECDLVRDWQQFSRLGTDVFRFYGRMTEEGFRTIDLETEFRFFTDDDDAKAKVEEFARAMGATMNLMDESPCIDRILKPEDADWTVGPNDGRMETQVDVCLNVFGQDPDDVAKVVEKWRHEIHERGIAQHWVSVI